MSGLPLDFLFNALIFILFPLLGGVIMTRLRLPRMLGYILSGMALGALTKGTGADSFLSTVGDIGLILLLFAVGLETNIGKLRRFGRLLVGIGVSQMVLTTVVFFSLVIARGASALEAFIIAFAFSLSSTALVSKIIQEKGEEDSLMGSLTIGMLILQDLMVIPFMILLVSLGSQAGIAQVVLEIVVTSAKTLAILAFMYVVGQKLAPFVFSKTANLSKELLNLLTLFVVILSVFVFSYLGLSSAIAAFAAGVIIGGTMQHYQIFSQMRPLRDLFTILFFVVMGATLDVSELVAHLPSTLLFVLVAMTIKFVIVDAIFTYFKFHSKTAFSGALMLSQIGEFAFVVLRQAQQGGVLSNDMYYFAITSTLLTITISPILIDRKDAIYATIRKLIRSRLPAVHHYITYRLDSHPAHIDVLKLKGHVVICGYGRVGSYIGRALTMAHIPFIAIDYNSRIVEEHKKKGVNIIYGDPSDIDILDFAETEHALMLVSAVPDQFSQEMIVLNAKVLNPKIMILSRVAVEAYRQRIKDLGAEIVVQPEFEAALSIVKKVLIGFNIPKKDIVGKVKRLKIEHGMA
ncbi:MAG: Inner membrane protein YbaL [Microgenomates bacterium OLB23]|nr:MAG: Inner membrane protein YbaL [Microgenomates bacterium OLB23]